MILWRISEFAALDGMGGTIVAGRWHSKGRPIVYLSDSSALTMLEVLVHLETDRLPPPFQLMRIAARDDLALSSWDGEKPPTDLVKTRGWGDAWLERGETAFARVPSAVAPGGLNMLLNPRHRDAADVAIVAASRWPWDRRLFRF